MSKKNPLQLAALLAVMWITGASLANAAGAADSKVLADYLITKTVHPGGVIALPRCGDGQLALALAKRTEAPIVYAADARPDQYTTARAAAAQAGLLGRNVYVQQAKAESLPLADSYADLVVLADLADADLQPSLLAEVQRILVPQTGHAVVGRAKSAAGTGTLTRATFEAWARAGGKATDVKIVEDAQGLWAVFGRPALPGADDWTHWFHAPDGNPLSADKAFDGMPQIAWMAKPYRLPRQACRVESRGRIYYVTGGNPHWADWDETLIWNIFAYNAFNGRLLWNKPWPEGQRTDGSVIIADGDTLLAVDGAFVKRMDGATGKELGRFAPAGANAGQIKWMALIDGLLTVHIGPPELVDKKAKPLTNTKENLGYGSILMACDPATGRQVWRYDSPKPMDCQQIAAAAGHLYFCIPGAGVTCLDTKTGKQVWVNATPEVTALLEQEKGVIIRWKERPGLVCTPEAVYAGIFDSPGFVALSAKDGKVLWSKSQGKRTPEQEAKFLADGHMGSRILSLVRGNNFIVRGGLGGSSHFFNAVTGVADDNTEKVTTFGAGCGTFTASAKYLIGQAGGPLYDFDKHQNLPFLNTKTACSLGQFVAQGQLYTASYDCYCDWTTGFSSLAPAGNLDYKRPQSVAEQLVTGPGDIQKVVPLPTDARDWSTHRGNVSHTGCIATEAPTAAPRLLWTYTNPTPFTNPKRVPFSEETDYKITEPVTAGGLVFFGYSDGRVQCLSATDGSPKWTYWTEAGIFAAPTVAEGRLYVGSADGRVYALEAATGRLLWRFRPGPSDRRVLIFGYLQSPWPVNSGVLVANGVAYAAAGMRLQPGSYVVALDAVTGKPRWQHMDPAAANDVDKITTITGLIPDGYLTLAAGRLWVRTCQGKSGGYSFDPATGKDLSPEISTHGLMGREIGVLRDRYLIYGGGDIYNSQDFRDYPRGGIGLLELEANGTPQLPDKCFVSPSCLASSWNQDKIVTVTGADQGLLQCWDATRMIAWACNPAKYVDMTKLPPKQRPGAPKPHGVEEQGYAKDAQAVRLWGPFPLRVNGLVLTPQTVLLAEGGKAVKGSGGQPGAWQLSALSLADGKPRWQTPLPSEPVTNAMSVDRDGRILLGLRNGNVVCYGVK